MARKLSTLRSAMITTTALIAGSTADAIAQSTATYLSSHQQSIGELIIAMTASRVLDRLNNTNKLTTTWIQPLSGPRYTNAHPASHHSSNTGV